MEYIYLSNIFNDTIGIEEAYLKKWRNNLSLISDFYKSATCILTQREGDFLKILPTCHNNSIQLNITDGLSLESLIGDVESLSDQTYILKNFDRFQNVGELKFKSILVVPVFYPDDVLMGYIILLDEKKDCFDQAAIKLSLQIKELIEVDLKNIYLKFNDKYDDNFTNDLVCKVLYEKSGALNCFYSKNLKLSFYNDNFKSTFLTADHNVVDLTTVGYKNYYNLILPNLKEVVKSNQALNSIDKIEYNGSNMWFNLDFNPISDNSNQLIGVYVVANNITDLIITKQRMLNKKQDLLEYERIFNLVANPICIADINGVFIKTNPAFYRILGFTSEEVQGRSMFEMIHPNDLKRTVDYISEKIKEQPELLEFENRYVCKDGSSVWFSWMVQPIYEKGISYSVAHDITTLKETQEELSKAKEHAEESDRLKTAFLCNMSHEIRTPMNGIVGFSDLLKSTALQNEELEYYCDIIRSSGQQLLRIVNDIIDISKIEIGEVDIIENEVNINELIRSIAAFYKPDIASKGLEIITMLPLPDKDAILKSDETKLRQILDNLLSNALKFTENGFLKIAYEVQGTDIVISVEDTGIGIPENKRKNIFERFAQLKDPNKSYGGAGLGLAICKAYINKMGGDIWVETSMDSGSIFKFTLPFIV
ncbi:sensor histidine kinase [Plebeiibacterium sediminum]|uniref:histidine kinase n=1 Tax=Plebeiibacterium sediminum TaxID=2992112 RepID=A0AAE3M3M5_9BACT|nr:PAS domain-containing hybrid sensor histidine kinase/response regulator [Plebeiobacterium sediminum]MCW3786381.1 ATP-binding protein [Plebeiobacterium sediminum]